jgi:hypothetical protein
MTRLIILGYLKFINSIFFFLQLLLLIKFNITFYFDR